MKARKLHKDVLLNFYIGVVVIGENGCVGAG